MRERRLAMQRAKQEKAKQAMVSKVRLVAENSERIRHVREEQCKSKKEIYEKKAQECEERRKQGEEQRVKHLNEDSCKMVLEPHKKVGDCKTDKVAAQLNRVREEAEKNRPKLKEIFASAKMDVTANMAAVPLLSHSGQSSQDHNDTFNIPKSAAAQNLTITPGLVHKVAELVSYEMTPVQLDDSDDDFDENDPNSNRMIPKWARSSSVASAISKQCQGETAEMIFSPSGLATCDLTKIFERQRPRYHKRTSSAVWTHSSPIVYRNY